VLEPFTGVPVAAAGRNGRTVGLSGLSGAAWTGGAGRGGADAAMCCTVSRPASSSANAAPVSGWNRSAAASVSEIPAVRPAPIRSPASARSSIWSNVCAGPPCSSSAASGTSTDSS
jgi:hypothetical protein